MDNTIPEPVLLDFSNMFKNSNAPQRKLKKQENDDQNDEELIANIVPRNISITQEEMSFRRCLDIRRWYCLSRPQYQRSCGISSVVTVWNYLFSNLGVGQLQPISQEEAIVKLGLAKEVGVSLNDVEFGSISGNMSLIKWFKLLCQMYKVKGRAYYLWKTQGQNSTVGVDRDLALEKMEAGLRTDKHSYIYHAYDHYFCPIGYEITPFRGYEAYLPYDQMDKEKAEHWIIIAESAKPHPFFTVRKWKDIALDLELELPKYINIRQLQEGVKEYKNAVGASQHCIMAFERVDQKVKKNGGKLIKKDLDQGVEDQQIEHKVQQQVDDTKEQGEQISKDQQEEIIQILEDQQRQLEETSLAIGEKEFKETIKELELNQFND